MGVRMLSHVVCDEVEPEIIAFIFSDRFTGIPLNGHFVGYALHLKTLHLKLDGALTAGVNASRLTCAALTARCDGRGAATERYVCGEGDGDGGGGGGGITIFPAR